MLSFRFRWREIYYRFTLSLKIYLSITWRAQTLMCPGQTLHLLIWLFILPNTSSTGKGRKEFGTQSSTYVTLIHNIQALSLEEIIVLLDERLHMEITNTHFSFNYTLCRGCLFTVVISLAYSLCLKMLKGLHFLLKASLEHWISWDAKKNCCLWVGVMLC